MPVNPDEIVARIRRSMRAAGDPDAAELAAVRTICRGCDIPYGEVWTTYTGGSVLYLKAAWHRPGPHLATFEAESRKIALAVGVGVPGRVWEARAPVVLADLHITPDFSRQAISLAAGFRSAVGVPVFLGEELAAALVFMMFDRRRERLDQIGRLAASVGLELARSRPAPAADWPDATGTESLLAA